MVVTKNNADEYLGMALMSYHPRFHYYPLWIMKLDTGHYVRVDATGTMTFLGDDEEIQFDIARPDIQRVLFCEKCDFYDEKYGFCIVMQRKMAKKDFCSYGFPKRRKTASDDWDRPCPDYLADR